MRPRKDGLLSGCRVGTSREIVSVRSSSLCYFSFEIKWIGEKLKFVFYLLRKTSPSAKECWSISTWRFVNFVVHKMENRFVPSSLLLFFDTQFTQCERHAAMMKSHFRAAEWKNFSISCYIFFLRNFFFQFQVFIFPFRKIKVAYARVSTAFETSKHPISIKMTIKCGETHTKIDRLAEAERMNWHVERNWEFFILLLFGDYERFRYDQIKI